jgi:hypothetical protein
MGTGGGLVVIDFSENGNSAYFRQEGWSGQEPDRVWGIGPRSVLAVPIQSSGRPIVLEVELAPCESLPNIMGQIVRVGVNGTALGHVRIDGRSMIRTEIDPKLARQDGVLKIDFAFPGFHRPALSCDSTDDRPLSCWFSFVRIYTMDMFKPGPWFPTSHPDVPIARLLPPVAEASENEVDAEWARYSFGEAGTAKPFLGDGWHVGVDNFTSTVRSNAELKLPALRAPGFHAIRLDASPVMSPGEDPNRDVTVLLDGIAVGQFSPREASNRVLPLPRELTEGRDVLPLNFMLYARPREGSGTSNDMPPPGIAVSGVSVFQLPSTFASAECVRAEEAGMPRPMATSGRFLDECATTLPATIRAMLGLDVVTLTRGFESLGTNHEFAIVQRKLGVDVLHLFRFCEGTLTDLTRALADDLTVASDPDIFTVEASETNPLAYLLTLPPYNLHWRMFGHDNDADRNGSRHANAITLGYLRRKFYEGLRSGRKIYVLARERSVPASEAAALLMELNRTAEATLLCVEQARNDHAPGEVELLMPGLMRGYIERFAPDTDADAVDLANWLRVLANATLLKRATGAMLLKRATGAMLLERAAGAMESECAADEMALERAGGETVAL